MRKQQYLDHIMSRDFYDFYRKIRRKPSKIIDQYNYFEKAINGMITELRTMLSETETGVHLKGLGVFYRKPFGEILMKVSKFTHKKVARNMVNFYLEDDFIRNQYFIANTPFIKMKEIKKVQDKSTAILLHRKLKLKK